MAAGLRIEKSSSAQSSAIRRGGAGQRAGVLRASVGEHEAAADLHVAVIGDTMTGIVHTSKIYGALGVGRPVLTIGPERSHLAEIVKKNGVGFHIRHGDVELGSKIIHDLALSSKEERAIFQKNAKQTIEMYYSKSKLCGKLCNFLEEMVKKMG